MADPFTDGLLDHIKRLLGWKDLAPPNSPSGGGGAGQSRVPGPTAGPYVPLLSPGLEEAFFPWLHPLSPASRGTIFSSPPQTTNPAAPPPPAASAAPATPTPAPAATSSDPLKVSEGQVTFDAEGNDTETSPYFSRKVIWPGGLSGVTIGRGYDMGSRTKASVKADLVAAGMSDADATAYAEGAALNAASTPTAKKWVEDNKPKLNVMSREVQKKLFENIYPGYKTRAKTNYDKWTKDDKGAPLPGKVEFDQLDQAIRDIVVDFVYQGFTQGPNPMTNAMTNDYDTLIKYIEGSATLQQYEAGRHRVDYLKAAKKAAGK